MVRSFHDNATRLLSFFIRSIASSIFWHSGEFFWTKSGTRKDSWCLKNSLRTNRSFKNRRFSTAYTRFVLLAYFITAPECDGPRMSVRSFTTDDISIYLHDPHREDTIFWSRKHIDEACSHLPISWLKSLHLLIGPVSSAGDIENSSSDCWSQDQYARDSSGMIAIAPASFGKNKIPYCESENHANSPQIRECKKPAILRLYPSEIGTLRERKFENHKCTRKWTEDKRHNTARPESDMQEDILPPRSRTDMIRMNISKDWISDGCIFHARHS